MFDKLKQINQLRELQKQIRAQRVEEERGGVKIVMSGEFELIAITLNPALDVREQERAIIACANSARQKIQSLLARKFSSSMSELM